MNSQEILQMLKDCMRLDIIPRHDGILFKISIGDVEITSKTLEKKDIKKLLNTTINI